MTQIEINGTNIQMIYGNDAWKLIEMHGII